MPKLDNWCVTFHPFDRPSAFTPPECVRKCLHGIVTGHHKKADGTSVTTSYIERKTQTNQIVTSSGTIYDLGDVDPEYEKQYPGALETLLRSLENGQ